jgi:rubrerythrin
MKKSYITFIFIFAITSLVVTACNNDQTKPNLLINKENMNAENKTIENMQSAYKGEMTATAKYKAFAKKAEEEGFHSIAVLYNAVSAAENIHATNHKAVIEDAGATVPFINPEYKVKTTKENLSDDIKGEAYEATIMYPEFLKTAETAGNQIAFLSLTYAMKTEAKHKIFFQQALENLNNNTLNNLPSTYYVCPACGNTYSTAPKHCDFSLTERDKFIKFQ